MCAGFGRVGQIVGRILVGQRIPFTGLDIHPKHVETVRRFGNKVYFGDASRLDLLIAAKTDRARSFVLAIGDVGASLCTAETVRRYFAHVKLFARARNRSHGYRLMDLGAELIEREIFLGSLELVQHRLPALGIQAWDGGLAHVNILCIFLMGGLSGSSAGDCAALTKVLVPEMAERGYGLAFSAAVTSAASILANLIPPSIMFMVYGAVASVSIGRLFLAGILPSIVLTLAYMVAAHKKGVKAEIILDRRQRKESYGIADFLANSGIPTRIDSAHAYAYTKVMVVDEETVITGSFNFTKSAEDKNAENLLVIKDKELALKFAENWRNTPNTQSSIKAGRSKGKPAYLRAGCRSAALKPQRSSYSTNKGGVK